MSKSKSSSRCLQEAFDKLLQHTFQHWCQLTSFVNWWKVWKNRGEKNFRFWTIYDISCRCLQEAVDKLFQHTPKWKITHSLCFKLVFNSTQTLFGDEITSLWLKVRLPPDASRKQLTSCCSTPSNIGANWLHLSVDEKYEKIGVKKTSVFEQFMIFLADAFRKQLTSCSSTLQNEKIHIRYVSS